MKKFFFTIYTVFHIMMFSNTCNSQTIRLFAAKYNESGEKGFYIFDLNRESGTFKLVSETDAGQNPSYFCISKKEGLIYTANEVDKFNGIKGGGVTTLKYDSKTGEINKVSELTLPSGGPCFIALSPGDDFLLMASYGGGSVTVVKLNAEGIPISIADTIFYKAENGNVSHAHMISFDPAGKRVYLTDLGLDRIVIYNFDHVSGQLHQVKNGIVKLPKGTGPRHFVFNSDASKMYVIDELNSTISVFDVDTNGELKPVQTVTTLKEGFKGESFCADIHVGKYGDYLYGSNRGENTIVTFKIGSDGKLTLAGHSGCGGDWPRNFVIDPSGKYLLVGNQKSGNISLLRIDEKTGIPRETGKEYKLTTPACLKFSE